MTAALSRGKSLALTLALGLLLAFGITVGTAAPAAAAAGTFRLCNVASDYTAHATFNDGSTTVLVGPGQCTSTGLSSADRFYDVTIRGNRAGSARKTTTIYNIPPGRSIDFHTGGTFASPQFTPLVY